LINKIFQLNDGWLPDWTDSYIEHEKFYFEYNHSEQEIEIDNTYTYQPLKNELYFKSDEIGSQIIKELGMGLVKLAIGI